MVRIGSDEEVELDDGERMLQNAEEARTGWQQTLEDLEAMAADREESGFETLRVTSDDTTPKPPSASEDGEWGFVYIVPSNQAEEFEAFAERGAFDETLVYQAESAGNAFVVTECLDTDEDLVLYVAGTYRMQHAPALVEAALDRDKMFTHIKTLDGTTIGTIEHDDPEKFFPDPERYRAYDVDY